METLIEKDTTALGSLFQQIITDLKNGAPLWEDFVSKATKLHTCLRATLQAVGLYLEAFQKIADAATSSRGATKDIGTALTRICLRQRAVEARVKTFASALMECLVNPLQERLEDWKKTVITLDKEHSKETKRARSELKKRSTDTLRMQKKAARKGLPSAGSSSSLAQGITASMVPLDSQQRLLQCGLQQLGECEGRAVRAALTESRGRFCLFVALLKPVLDQEVAILWELGHVQEALDQLDKATGDPATLPEATEQVLLELTNASASQEAAWAAASGATERDSSPPSSLGSRKSSLGSANSLGSVQSLSSHSGGGSGAKEGNGNGWPQRASTMSQLSRPPPAWLRALSQDSGFNSSHDRLFPYYKGTNGGSGDGSNCSTPTTTGVTIDEVAAHAEATGNEIGTSPGNQPGSWPNLQETLQFERAASAIMADQQQQQQQQLTPGQQRRPHTISSAYSQPPSRPPVTSYHFSPPGSGNNIASTSESGANFGQDSVLSPSQQTSGGKQQQPPPGGSGNNGGAKPSVPKRCSSLERPSVLAPKPQRAYIDNVNDELTPNSEEPVATPVYVNMHELANLAANKSTERGQGDSKGETEKDSSASESSLESSSGYGSQTIPLHNNFEDQATMAEACGDQLGELFPPPPPSPLLRQSQTRLHRPMSFSGYPPQHAQMGGMRPPVGTMSRRGSTSAPPPPPIRRTSSISTVNKSCLPTPADDLPPPPSPSFLQQQQEAANRRVAEMIHNFAADANRSNNVADTVRSLTELRHTPASPGLARKSQETIYARNSTVADTVRNLTDVRHHPAFKPNADDPIYRNSAGVAEAVRNLTERKHQPASPNLGRKELDDPKSCVADTVRTLTELRHTPASPISQRRTTRLSSENLAAEELYTRSPVTARKIYHDPRILDNYSPGTSRKIYAEQQQMMQQHHPQHHPQHLSHQQLPHQQQQQQQQGVSTFKVTRKPEYEDPTKLRGSLLQAIKLSKLGKEANRHVRRLSEDYEHRRDQPQQEQQQTLLLQSLTSRLAQMQSGNRAYRVRTLIASKTVRDPTIVHDSLMDQIRRGTVLRHATQDEANARM